MSSQQINNPFDNDLNAYLNFDEDNIQTPMSSSTDVKPVPALLHQSSTFTSSSDAFSGPSYQYDSHRQQTGLPMGGYANTLAINQAAGLHYRPTNHNFIVPQDTLNMPLMNLDEFDFNRPQAYDFSGDMDVEASPADVPSMFYGAEGSNISPATQIPPRIYPGMHTKQANQAKIQQAQKQQEMIQRQQQQRSMPAGQKPLPTSDIKSPVAKDPHVEESISRLLNRMRQSSNATIDDEDSPVAGQSHLARIKKDEDDMDEDERLLNSEEGKKLSSKERRQLRNKVSARAFRSRRKEYIGQLENEVAQKAQEANELRVQNRQLMEENQRLTDLTRMLLSSNSFAGFLQELSQTGGNLPSNVPMQRNTQQHQQPQQQTQPQPQSQSQPTRKDISAHEANQQIRNSQTHMQVGMTLIPETTVDMSVFDGPASWNNILPSNDFSVFSVTEVPKPPKLDVSSLAGKSQTPRSRAPTSSKKDAPVISAMPNFEVEAATRASDDLYDNAELVSITLPKELHITMAKAAVTSDLLCATRNKGSWPDLQHLCKQMDESCKRIAELMP